MTKSITETSQSWYVRPRVASFSHDICQEIQAAFLVSGNSGYEGCCDGKIYFSLRDEVGMSATPIETQGAPSAQLCCAIACMAFETEGRLGG
jgi:hypothetical protein